MGLQQHDESRALNDMSGRIKQLTKLILTSETVADSKGDMVRDGDYIASFAEADLVLTEPTGQP